VNPVCRASQSGKGLPQSKTAIAKALTAMDADEGEESNAHEFEILN
jgi:hypothetical protein